MDDLPTPVTITKLAPPELVGGLPVPQVVGQLAAGGGEAPVPLPLEQLMGLSKSDTAPTLPEPKSFEQLTNK
jgi:hypothetical protein